MSSRQVAGRYSWQVAGSYMDKQSTGKTIRHVTLPLNISHSLMAYSPCLSHAVSGYQCLINSD